MLELFCAQLGLRLTADDLVERNLADLVQVRHTIRGQLTGVLGNIDLLYQYGQEAARRNGADPWITKAAIRKALARSKAFAVSIRALLDVSRALMTGVTSENLRLGSISLPRLVGEVCFALRFLTDQRNINIKISNLLGVGTDVYTMDRGLMEIVFHNLLDNAIKYSFRGRDIEVKIGVRGREWYVSMTDTGVYIRPEDRETIFEMFVRRPTGASALQRPGTGLGLSFVRDIVKAHGGRIEVQSDLISTPGDSDEQTAVTCFTVYIPRELRDKRT